MNPLKSLFLALGLVAGASAQAEARLVEDLARVESVAAERFKIVDLRLEQRNAECPPGLACPAVHRPVTHTVITIEMQHGCMNHLVGDIFKSVEGPVLGRVLVQIGATEIQYEASNRVRCVRAPTTRAEIAIQGRFSKTQIQLVNLKKASVPQAQ